MSGLFISVLNMSITSSYIILAVLLCRLVLKGMPKKYSYVLWSVVGFRLVCPVSFNSAFSLFSLKLFDMSKAQSVNENALSYVQENAASKAGEITVGIPTMNSVIESGVTSMPVYENAVNPVLLSLTAVWACGILALVAYSAVKFIQLNQTLKIAVKTSDNTYKSENIVSPFIVGIIRPKIYIPSGIDENYMQYVLAHERYHIKRFDNGVKLLAYFLLVLHWFNPLVWLAFYLMTKDMEMSCDEAIISKNPNVKKIYSTALLSFAVNKKFPAPSPISFSENGVKARIKNVLKYKKPIKLLRVIAIIFCLALLTACAANPKITVNENTVTTINKNTFSSTESDNNISNADSQISYNDIRKLYVSGKYPTLRDFEDFEHSNEGSGIYIYKLPIADENGAYIRVGGIHLDEPVMYIYFSPDDEEENDVLLYKQYDMSNRGSWYENNLEKLFD